MKKIALILVAVLLATSLIACNNAEDEDGSFGVSAYSESARQQDIVVDGVTVGTITYEAGTGKAAIITDYTGIYSPHKVVIPETVGEGDAIRTVTEIGPEAFYFCSSLTAITLPSTVEKIGAMAFAGCNNLESITIPANVTSIDKYAFALCSGLKSITFAEGSKLKTIGDFAFNECTSLEAFEIPATTESIGRASFRKCEKIASIKTPAGLLSIGDMAFSGCAALNAPGAVDVSASVNIENVYVELDGKNVLVPNLGNYIFSGIKKNYIIVPEDGNSALAEYVANMIDVEEEEAK